MNKINPRAHVGCYAALIATAAILSGCGPAPYSTTKTSEQTITTTPAPMVSTTTTTTERASQLK